MCLILKETVQTCFETFSLSKEKPTEILLIVFFTWHSFVHNHMFKMKDFERVWLLSKGHPGKIFF